MKIKKSGNIKKKSLEGNNKIITFRRCSKTNTSDRIAKKNSGRLSKKKPSKRKPQQQKSI